MTASGAILPGIYATTEEDAKHVKTGRDAVKRYALPNPAPAVYVFTIDPPLRTNLKRGVAQPAYGQPGGGVEVIFVNGSPDQTVTGPAQIHHDDSLARKMDAVSCPPAGKRNGLSAR